MTSLLRDHAEDQQVPFGEPAVGPLERENRIGRRRRLRPEHRKRQIIETAVQLIHRVGFEAANLRDLAAAVGINKATLYHYFRDKEEILFDIVHGTGEELLEGVRTASESSDRPLDALEAMIRFQLGYVESHTKRIRILVEDKKSLESGHRKQIRAMETEILDIYEEVLARCRNDGTVRPLHVATSAFAILGQINWLYHWYQPAGRFSIPELTDQVVTILFHGLLCPPTSEVCTGRQFGNDET